MKLRFVPIKASEVPRMVAKGDWRVPQSGPDLKWLRYGTQSCKLTDDDGSIIHYAYVCRRGRRKGPWLKAVEREGQDVRLSG